MLNFIDIFLDKITMYRLTLYYLMALLFIAFVLSFFRVFSFSTIDILFSTIFILAVAYLSNFIFSKVFEAPANIESVYITAFILALILTPSTSIDSLPLYFFSGLLSMASKYILAINKKHVFNPVAIAVVLTAFGFNESASWWIGTSSMAIFVILGGLLLVKKIQREKLVFTFFIVAIIESLLFSISKGTDLSLALKKVTLDSSLFFLGFVMLTEPLTSPPTKGLQTIYGALVGVLFPPQVKVLGIASTPELALIVGNIFSYIVSPKLKLIMFVSEKIKIGEDIIDFIFPLKKRINFTPGQYMEWTLSHEKPDSRGNRRYFTIASSPTETNLRLGIKFYERGSSFKNAMTVLSDESPIVGGQLSGDFTLPKDKNKKLLFIAGGIGITPYRSMIKYLIDKNEKRDIILFYSNKYASEIMYKDVFDEALDSLGIKTIYTLTDKSRVPLDWVGKVGRVDKIMIEDSLTDWKDRYYYLSGPHVMVVAFEDTLKKMGIPKSQIKIDFFPGFV